MRKKLLGSLNDLVTFKLKYDKDDKLYFYITQDNKTIKLDLKTYSRMAKALEKEQKYFINDIDSYLELLKDINS